MFVDNITYMHSIFFLVLFTYFIVLQEFKIHEF